MTFYTLVNTTPFYELSQKLLKQISRTAIAAEESDFDSSKRLGASLQYKGTYFLCS